MLHGRDCMVVGFTTTYAISAYHHWCCEFKSRSGQGVQHCQWLATDRWFSLGPPDSSTYKTNRHDMTEILLKVVLSTIKQTTNINKIYIMYISSLLKPFDIFAPFAIFSPQNLLTTKIVFFSLS